MSNSCWDDDSETTPWGSGQISPITDTKAPHNPKRRPFIGFYENKEKTVPYMTNGKRDYKRENEEYNSRPENIKKRSERTTARRQANAAGITHKGDGKDLDHIKPLSKGGTSAKSNLRVTSAGENRSFSRNKDGSMKSQTSKREAKRK
jgi:hypothetical protein